MKNKDQTIEKDTPCLIKVIGENSIHYETSVREIVSSCPYSLALIQVSPSKNAKYLSITLKYPYKDEALVMKYLEDIRKLPQTKLYL